MLDSAFERVRPIRVTLTETGHELAVRLRVTAVPITGFLQGWRKPLSKRFNDPASNFVLDVEDVVQREVILLGRNALLRHCIEEVHRDTPATSEFLDVSLQEMARSEFATGAVSVGSSSVLDNGRCRKDGRVVESAEHRNQCISKPQGQSSAIFDPAQENKRQHGIDVRGVGSATRVAEGPLEGARLPRASRTASAN